MFVVAFYTEEVSSNNEAKIDRIGARRRKVFPSGPEKGANGLSFALEGKIEQGIRISATWITCKNVFTWYYDQIFTPWFFSVSHRISWKNKNAVYCLQISAIVPEIFKFEKWVKYANEMTDDVIHSTQYYLVNKPAGMSDNVRGFEIVRKMNIWPRSEASRTKLTYQWAGKGFIYFFIKYLRQYAHSHWSIGVFRW